MSDSFQLQGSWQTTPQAGSLSGELVSLASLNEYVTLKRKSTAELDLTTDDPVVVSLGGNIHVLHVKTIGGKARVRFTSADGAAQALPVDGVLEWICQKVPVTALDVTRETGVNVQVKLFFGEKA